MLRSRRVSWMTAGGMVMLASMTGCEEAPKAAEPSFGSVEQCMLAGNPKADCEAAAEKVTTEHLATAPKYADGRSCEAIHGVGNCEPRRSSSGIGEVFMPAVAGFLLGRVLSGGGIGAPQPIYRDPRGYTYMPGQAPWIQPPANREDQGRGRTVWSGGAGGTTVNDSVARTGSSPSPTLNAPAASAQRGVLGGTGRSSATSASAGS
jgi:uncharacterized protein YgiB involved in biofilm formation